MTDHDAFLEAIVERSDDDFPRLHYADWLDERGDPRGEFIRVQCALAGMSERDCNGYYCDVDLETGEMVHRNCRWARLHHREQELLSMMIPNRHGGRSCNTIARAYWTPRQLWPLGRSSSFRRGFIAHVTLPHDVFLEHAAALFCAAPIEAVTLSDRKPRILGTTAAWHRGYRFRTPDPEDLDPAIWDCLALAVEKREPWCWYDTVEEANADLSSACVKLGRKRAAKAREEMVNQ